MSEPTQQQIAEQQYELASDMEQLRQWGEEHPDRFAGLWFDNKAAQDGTGPVRIAIAVVEDTTSATQELRLLVDHPDRVVVIAKRFTYQELRRLQEEITHAYLMGRRPSSVGTYVSGVGVDVRANKVHVSISTNDDEFATIITERYGADRIRVEKNVRFYFYAPTANPDPRPPSRLSGSCRGSREDQEQPELDKPDSTE
jgi:hypothetical protein